MLKRHIGNTKGIKLNMKIFFFQTIKCIKTLKVEGIGYNVREDIEKYIKNVVSFKVGNILYL
jgi:hypothetical protein